MMQNLRVLCVLKAACEHLYNNGRILDIELCHPGIITLYSITLELRTLYPAFLLGCNANSPIGSYRAPRLFFW